MLLNKKAVLTFLLGGISSALLLGGVFYFFAVRQNAHDASLTPLAPVSEAIAMPGVVVAQAFETPAFKSLLSAQLDSHSMVHEVKPGDNLTLIAKKYNTTIELLKKINNLSSDRLLPGMKFKVPTYRFSVVVDKSQNILLLKGDEEVLKTYAVSTGENNNTPIGVFKVTEKLINPAWYKAGAVVPYGSPENILGTRWIGISKEGYGLHGTTGPDKLGQQVTAGCVRMRNEEVEELYTFLTPGSEVTIVD